ncbi:hypothetical protein ACI3PL_30450, partial [Lacticaseibacillus paracasei]
GWYWNINPENGEPVGMVNVIKAGKGYFVSWSNTPEVDEDKIKQTTSHGQGHRRDNVLAIVWGMNKLSTYKIQESKEGVK